MIIYFPEDPCNTGTTRGRERSKQLGVEATTVVMAAFLSSIPLPIHNNNINVKRNVDFPTLANSTFAIDLLGASLPCRAIEGK